MINEGAICPADTTVSVEFGVVPAGLSWNCQLESGPVACGDPAGLTEAATLAAGENMLIEAYGTMPAGELPVTATLAVTGTDNRADDNTASATVEADMQVFGSGFEP